MVSIFLRSLVYNVLFYLLLAFWVILGIPTYLMPRWAIMNIARYWARSSIWMLRVICNVKVEYRGLEKIPKGPLIVASKHQSMWETFALLQFFDQPLFILKRELKWIPFFGWYLIKSNMIGIPHRMPDGSIGSMPDQPATSGNQPAASVSLMQNGQQIGSWSLASGFPQPIQFRAGPKPFTIVLRPKRYYRPFSITLEEFRHDRYAGTEIAKNFSSKVRLVDPSVHENREALIFMNHPLRYAGLTFYQAGFGNDDATTVLQVMKNPSWLVPYISCGMMALGLVIQFGMHLISFVRRRVIA